MNHRLCANVKMHRGTGSLQHTLSHCILQPVCPASFDGLHSFLPHDDLHLHVFAQASLLSGVLVWYKVGPAYLPTTLDI